MRRLIAALSIALAIVSVGASAPAQTIKAVMDSDVKIIDPIWSGAYVTRAYGYMVYDTLFSMDAKYEIQPQMVDTWKVSEDGLTWTFVLRDGLEWHDGQPVTAEDCVASLKRWSARDSLGQKLAADLSQYKVVDQKTFQILLKKKFGPMLTALGKPSVVVPFMMPKRVAETDPFKQIDEAIGSGPFILKRDEWKPGEKIVFVKNPRYKPRAEPMSGLAGGKRVLVDRVEWVWIPDAETQINALLNGEIDWIQSVDHDHLPLLKKAKGIKLLPSSVWNQFAFRPNWTQPPLDNVKVRQAVAYALDQRGFLESAIGNDEYYRTCKAMFTCGSPLATTVGTNGMMEGNIAKAKELLKEANYDGTPIVMPQPTDLGVMKNMGTVAKAQLEKAGIKVEVQPMDWQGMVARLTTKKGPPSAGGWNAYGTSWSQLDILDPAITPFLSATCEKARSGWPCDAHLEELRDKFIDASTPEERKAAAEEVQAYALRVVTHIPLGEWRGVGAARDNMSFPSPLPQIGVFWGVSKK
ncbi:MAG: ABC transporter substrate-binding protein [Proteobacteria bacterium]|nr:ABC transporter substrate-binding protein [Pseudomonadota bacterium]